MMLGELIRVLEGYPKDRRILRGFARPHSYRGFYRDLGFVVAGNITVGEMLAAARRARGATYHGWKGGEYTMGEHTDCWLVDAVGQCGETLGPMLLSFMLEDEV